MLPVSRSDHCRYCNNFYHLRSSPEPGVPNDIMLDTAPVMPTKASTKSLFLPQLIWALDNIEFSLALAHYLLVDVAQYDF